MKDYHKILIVSNMIPDKKHPSYGVFVKNFIEQMEHLHLPFDVSAMYMSDGKLSKLLGYIRFYMKTYKSILSGKYDLVYVHYPSFSFIPVNAARLVRRFDIMTNLHGSDVIPLKRIHKIMNLYFLRFSIPIQILVTEIVGRELLQAIEGDLLVVDVTEQVYGAVSGLYRRKYGINVLVTILIGNLTEDSHALGFLQRGNGNIPNWFIFSYILLCYVLLYKIHF